MRYFASVLSVTIFLAAAHAQQPKSPTHQVELNGQTFTLPIGFTIEVAVPSKFVPRPITLDFDEKGRLYVADSSGSNENVQIQLKKKPHRIVRVEDTDGDGVYDKANTFADYMMFPEGTMWHDGSLYVSAPPSIWKLTDTTGKGVADQRSEWFQGKTLTGCANDLHGPYRGPDGWIYWCKGAFAEQTYERPGKKPLVTKAAHIFRCRPDGTGVEPVMTSGMDNPVDMAIMPNGERIFCGTFLVYPAAGNRDGLQHGVIGGIYGKEYTDVLANHPWTSPHVMPVLSHQGPAAPCGMTRYESAVFGKEYRDNLFTCLFNMQKVVRSTLTPTGATFDCKDENFVVSSSKDFHPTDVMEDADGSLLIVDTGGWYKLCCPTSQLVKPDVLGAVYRVRKTDAPRLTDPRGEKITFSVRDVKGMIALLNDPRPVVRRRAIETLAMGDDQTLLRLMETLTRGESAEARRNAVWVATRMDSPQARRFVRMGLANNHVAVRQVALHSVSLHRDAKALEKCIELLADSSLAVRRVACEALGRIGDPAAIPALLAMGSLNGDRFVDHSRIYALIELNDPKATAAGLSHSDADVRRVALTALDQMETKTLQASQVLPELAAKDAKLRETAWWIASRHPEWGNELSGVLAKRLNTPNLSKEDRDELTQQLAKLAKSPTIQKLLAEQIESAPEIVLKAMATSNLREAPDAWVSALAETISKNPTPLEAMQTLRALKLPKKIPESLLTRLRAIGETPLIPERIKVQPIIRLTALAAIPGGMGKVDGELLAFLASNVRSDQPVGDRALAAEVLSKASLTNEQLTTLCQSFAKVGPMEFDRLLEPFGRSSDEAVGLTLLKSLEAPNIRPMLRVDMVKTRLTKYGPAVQKQAEALYLALNADLLKQRDKLEKMVARLKDGDVHRGHLVFNNPKVSCVACHTIGYLGGKTGPDLTRIGGIRTERDLLESILFPSSSFVRGYEPVSVVTKNGQSHNGLVQRDLPDQLILATGPNQEMRILRNDIEEIIPSSISIMPAGLEQQLSERDLADLVAFLRACR